ncbi:hypothetical protein TYRP_003190 [Tyrophagus putrescentiae]|nr:hypothetical protein TYRP_003190 [Tyrophagus putrescentiae]
MTSWAVPTMKTSASSSKCSAFRRGKSRSEAAGAGNGGHVEVVVAEVDEDGVVVEDDSPEKCIFILLSLVCCGGHREQDKLGADQQEVGKVQAEVPYSGASPLNAQQIYVVEVFCHLLRLLVLTVNQLSGTHFESFLVFSTALPHRPNLLHLDDQLGVVQADVLRVVQRHIAVALLQCVNRQHSLRHQNIPKREFWSKTRKRRKDQRQVGDVKGEAELAVPLGVEA